MSLTALTSILRSAWRRPKQPLVQLPQNSVKIYEQTPPAWARWALVLVSVDVMVSCVLPCFRTCIYVDFFTLELLLWMSSGMHGQCWILVYRTQRLKESQQQQS